MTLAGNSSPVVHAMPPQGVGKNLRVAVNVGFNTSIFSNSSLTPPGRCGMANVSHNTSAGLDALWAFAPPLAQNNSLCTYSGSACGQLRVTDFSQYVTVNGSGWGIAPFSDVWLEYGPYVGSVVAGLSSPTWLVFSLAPPDYVNTQQNVFYAYVVAGGQRSVGHGRHAYSGGDPGHCQRVGLSQCDGCSGSVCRVSSARQGIA